MSLARLPTNNSVLPIFYFIYLNYFNLKNRNEKKLILMRMKIKNGDLFIWSKTTKKIESKQSMMKCVCDDKYMKKKKIISFIISMLHALKPILAHVLAILILILKNINTC